jgi:uncharacterized Zn finger protein (UPF0148 family)
MKKLCGKCLVEKEISEFGSDKPKKDGKSVYCKICNNQRTKEWQKNNAEKVKDSQKEWRENNPNYVVDWQKNNSEKVNEKAKKWRREHPEYCKSYNIKNSHIVAWRRILSSTLNRMNREKEGHTIDLLGYSATDFKNYITTLFTDGMTWDNHGEWQIDHIKRVIEFDKNTPSHIVNALSNLRPLWATTREINGVIYEGNLNRTKKWITIN